jgi:hypothetical protein
MRAFFAAVVLAAVALPSAAQAPAPAPKPPPLSGAMAQGGFTPIRPLQGLQPMQGLNPVGDAGPQCRAGCTKDRAVCGDDQDCSDRWRTCVAACAAAPQGQAQ